MIDADQPAPCPMCGGELYAIDFTGYVACRDCTYWEYGTRDEGPRLAEDVPAEADDSRDPDKLL